MFASIHASSLVHAPISPPVACLSNNTFDYSDVAFVLCRGLDSVLFPRDVRGVSRRETTRRAAPNPLGAALRGSDY